MIIQGRFKILANEKIGPDYFKMLISSPRIAREARPGQFVHLRCQDSTQPLLRRPFSFHKVNKHNFEILYKIIGFGTNLLAKKQKGDKIDILGPLGNGFDLIRNTDGGGGNTIIVAGGMGVAPLLALAERLAHRKNISVLLGAKTKPALLCAKDFRQLGLSVKVSTDDGSHGYKGLVTDLLKRVLNLSTACPRKRLNCELSTIYACGPKPMLKEVARICRMLRIAAFASLEENMACGVGACLGCAVKTKAGYKRVCKDGPVFKLDEIEWGK